MSVPCPRYAPCNLKPAKSKVEDPEVEGAGDPAVVGHGFKEEMNTCGLVQVASQLALVPLLVCVATEDLLKVGEGGSFKIVVEECN